MRRSGSRKALKRRVRAAVLYGLLILILLGMPQRILNYLRAREYVVFGVDFGTLLNIPDAKAPLYYSAGEVRFEVPPYGGEPFTQINGGVPFFSEEEMTTDFFEEYSELDALGRCGAAAACLHRSRMPSDPREEIRDVRPTGFYNREYDFLGTQQTSFLSPAGSAQSYTGKWLYNRCHLIAYQLTGQNANEKNLITGTQYMNLEGMFPFERKVIDYLSDTRNHVMYRVTPVFRGSDLVAAGVLMEARSVEDGGRGLCFNVFCHNVQPGVVIDYRTGESRAAK